MIKHQDQNNLGEEIVSFSLQFSGHTPSLKEARAQGRTPAIVLKQRPWRNWRIADHWLASHGVLSWLPTHSRTVCPKVAPWILSHRSLMNLIEVFSQLRILFRGNSSLCEVDKKQTKTPTRPTRTLLLSLLPSPGTFTRLKLPV